MQVSQRSRAELSTACRKYARTNVRSDQGAASAGLRLSLTYNAGRKGTQERIGTDRAAGRSPHRLCSVGPPCGHPHAPPACAHNRRVAGALRHLVYVPLLLLMLS